MNENIVRLHDLVKEVNATINNLKQETEAIRNKYDEGRQIILDDMRDCWKNYLPIVNDLGCSIKVRLTAKSHYGDNYYIRLNVNPMYYPTVFSGRECCLNNIPWMDTYAEIRDNQYRGSGLHYRIDDILDGWNRHEFETAFAEEVQSILTKKAELANRNYEDAKRKLN